MKASLELSDKAFHGLRDVRRAAIGVQRQPDDKGIGLPGLYKLGECFPVRFAVNRRDRPECAGGPGDLLSNGNADSLQAEVKSKQGPQDYPAGILTGGWPGNKSLSGMPGLTGEQLDIDADKTGGGFPALFIRRVEHDPGVCRAA